MRPTVRQRLRKCGSQIAIAVAVGQPAVAAGVEGDAQNLRIGDQQQSRAVGNMVAGHRLPDEQAHGQVDEQLVVQDEQADGGEEIAASADGREDAFAKCFVLHLYKHYENQNIH